MSHKQIKAVIFDLDGTLVDSEPNYFEADRLLLSQFPQIVFDHDFKNRYIGVGSHDMLVDILARYKIDASLQQLLAEKNRIYLELARRGTALFPEMGI
jgi:beta-phosphoglucomutase-like phosphatase (HAD superfamily)